MPSTSCFPLFTGLSHETKKIVGYAGAAYPSTALLNTTSNVAYKGHSEYQLFIRLPWQISRPLERPIRRLAHGAPAVDELQILPLRLP